MAEQTIIIAIGDKEVTSTLEQDGATIWVTSTCGGDSQRNSITPCGQVDYSTEQAEYDIETARFAFARELAVKLQVQTVNAAVIQENTGDPPVVTGPRFQKPGSGQ